MSPQPENQERKDGPVVRRTGLFVRRGVFGCLGLALILDLIGLAMGLSEDGFGWAFQMPMIALSGLTAATVSLGGLICAILRLMHVQGRDGAIWWAMAGLLVTGPGGGILILLSLAASASV